MRGYNELHLTIATRTYQEEVNKKRRNATNLRSARLEHLLSFQARQFYGKKLTTNFSAITTIKAANGMKIPMRKKSKVLR